MLYGCAFTIKVLKFVLIEWALKLLRFSLKTSCFKGLSVNNFNTEITTDVDAEAHNSRSHQEKHQWEN